jgi:hypothetical protein
VRLSDNLDQLGPIGFQDLAASLAVASFGLGVRVMGAGRDGGRDLYHRGSLIWKPIDDHPDEVWEGYTVLPVKHMAAPSGKHQENAAWLWGQVRGEMDAWADPEGDRNPVPDFLIVITNVMLTPFPLVGGHDVLDANIASYLKRLKDVATQGQPPPSFDSRAGTCVPTGRSAVELTGRGRRRCRPAEEGGRFGQVLVCREGAATYRMAAVVTAGAKRDRPFARVVDQGLFFADQRAKVSHTTPVAVLRWSPR